MRLIDADAVLSEIGEQSVHVSRNSNSTVSMAYDIARTIIQEAPTIEAKPVNEKQNGWISVEDRLPEKSGWYLVFTKNGRTTIFFFGENEFPINSRYYNITHWHPIPAPPCDRK